MLLLELGKIRPLDVLLTSGDQKFSKAIRACTTLARGGRVAEFSHAALFVSPGLILESLFQEGVVFTNLVAPCADIPSSPRSPSNLLAQFDAGRLRLFVVLSEAGAAVFRHRVSLQLNADVSPWLRSSVFEVLAGLYLSEYSKIGRLIGVYDQLPKRVRDTVSFIAGNFESKIVPGPFCSELVAIAYSAISDAFPIEQLAPEKVAPSDFAAIEDVGRDFERLDDDSPVVLVDSPADLRGVPCDPGFISEITKILTTKALWSQDFNAKLIKLNALLPQALASLNGGKASDEEKETYAKKTFEDRRRWLVQIDEFVRTSCDTFWCWLEDANECHLSCLERRRSQGWKVNWPPLPTTLTTPSYKQPRYWDGKACKDVRECVCGSGSWTHLVQAHRDRREEELRAALAAPDSDP